MAKTKINTFESILLVVGVSAAWLGFHLINQVYNLEPGVLSWQMIIAIFNWLTLIVLFISLSIAVDTSKKQLEEIKKLVEELKHTRRKLI